MSEISNVNDYINIGNWSGKKMKYHKKSELKRIKRKQINQKEIWICDFGYNIGEEKNQERPVIILSKNKVNRTGKVLVAPITDAKNKMNNSHFPKQKTWYLLYSDTLESEKMFLPNRQAPKNHIKYNFIQKDSIIQCEEMRSVSKARLLGERKGCLDTSDWNILTKKLKSVFDID